MNSQNYYENKLQKYRLKYIHLQNKMMGGNLHGKLNIGKLKNGTIIFIYIKNNKTFIIPFQNIEDNIDSIFKKYVHNKLQLNYYVTDNNDQSKHNLTYDLFKNKNNKEYGYITSSALLDFFKNVIFYPHVESDSDKIDTEYKKNKIPSINLIHTELDKLKNNILKFGGNEYDDYVEQLENFKYTKITAVWNRYCKNSDNGTLWCK